MRALNAVAVALTAIGGIAWAVYIFVLGSDAGLPVPVLLVLTWGGVAVLVLWSFRVVLHVVATKNTPER